MIFVGPFQLNCFFSCHLLMMLHSTETVLTPGVHWPSSGLCWTHYNHTGGSASSHSTTQFSHPAHTPTCSFSMKVQQETASKPLMNSIQTISTTPPLFSKPAISAWKVIGLVKSYFPFMNLCYLPQNYFQDQVFHYGLYFLLPAPSGIQKWYFPFINDLDTRLEDVLSLQPTLNWEELVIPLRLCRETLPNQRAGQSLTTWSSTGTTFAVSKMIKQYCGTSICSRSTPCLVLIHKSFSLVDYSHPGAAVRKSKTGKPLHTIFF